MADNPYALRARFTGHAPTVLRYRFRFAVAGDDEAALADVREWWTDLVGVRGVCLPERIAPWRVLYVLAACAGVALSAYLLLVAQSLPAAAVALLATGVAFTLLWLFPPALLHIDRHGLWVVRQLHTGHVPWSALCKIECGGGEDDGNKREVCLTFKPGVEPATVTQSYRVQQRLRRRRRRSPTARSAVPGFATQAPPANANRRWRLLTRPAGLAPPELAMLLRWALEAHGNPKTTPQVWLDPQIPDTPIDDHEFDDHECYDHI